MGARSKVEEAQVKERWWVSDLPIEDIAFELCRLLGSVVVGGSGWLLSVPRTEAVKGVRVRSKSLKPQKTGKAADR